MVLGGGITLSVFVSFKPQYAHFLEFKSAIIIWLAASAVADLLITVTLTWSLVRGLVSFRLFNRLNTYFRQKENLESKPQTIVFRGSFDVRVLSLKNKKPLNKLLPIYSHSPYRSFDCDSGNCWSRRFSYTSGGSPYLAHFRHFKSDC